MIGKISRNFGEDLTWFGWKSLSWGFLIGDLEDGVIFDIIDHVERWFGRYPESLVKIRHDFAEKKCVPGRVGVGSGRVGVGFSLSLRNGQSHSISFSECKDRLGSAKDRLSNSFLFQGGLEDVGHSWLETWRVGSSWTLKMMLVVAKEPFLNVWSGSA